MSGAKVVVFLINFVVGVVVAQADMLAFGPEEGRFGWSPNGGAVVFVLELALGTIDGGASLIVSGRARGPSRRGGSRRCFSSARGGWGSQARGSDVWRRSAHAAVWLRPCP